MFNLLLFPIKVHGGLDIKFVSHQPTINVLCKFFQNEHNASKEERTHSLHKVPAVPGLNKVNKLDPDLRSEMRSMNGRDNEVIMCVYQGLSVSSYTQAHEERRAESQSLLLLLLASSAQRVRANSTPL